jgi:transposase
MPAFYYVIQDVRQVVTYPCDSDKPVTAKAEPSLLPRTQVTPELLAYIVISKVLDGLPIYRQEQQASRFHCPIPRDKLNRWFIGLGEQLTAFVEMLVAHFNEHGVGGIDETSIQVIREAGRTAEQKSYLFTRYGGNPSQPVMIVDYRQRKDYGTVKALLDDFESGHIVSDMNPSYIRFCKEHEAVTLNACHDHARRKFDAALILIPKSQRDGSFPDRILKQYGKLYDLEPSLK